jgi:hypothetical protein
MTWCTGRRVSQVEITNSRIGIMAREALADPEAFWAPAGEALPWRRRWDAVFDWDPDRPDERGRYFRWYRGGLTSIAWNAVGRHAERGRGGVPALVCENERGGRAVLTYAQLQEQVSQEQPSGGQRAGLPVREVRR